MKQNGEVAAFCMDLGQISVRQKKFLDANGGLCVALIRQRMAVILNYIAFIVPKPHGQRGLTTRLACLNERIACPPCES